MLVRSQCRASGDLLEASDLKFVPLRKVTFGADVGEKVRNVTEGGFLGAKAAGKQRLVHVVLAGLPECRLVQSKARSLDGDDDLKMGERSRTNKMDAKVYATCRSTADRCAPEGEHS
jgi:hypothetical protein